MENNKEYNYPIEVFVCKCTKADSSGCIKEIHIELVSVFLACSTDYDALRSKIKPRDSRTTVGDYVDLPGKCLAEQMVKYEKQ